MGGTNDYQVAGASRPCPSQLNIITQKFTIMNKSLAKLIEVADAIACHLDKHHYELHRYNDESYVDFHVDNLRNLQALLEKAAGLELRILHENNFIILRILAKC